jgi:hypothetical protein
MSLPKSVKRLNAFAAGVLLGLCVVTPTFAASFAFDTLPMRDWILMASLVLLAVALAVKLMRRRGAVDDVPDELEPDLRWWRKPDLA